MLISGFFKLETRCDLRKEKFSSEKGSFQAVSAFARVNDDFWSWLPWVKVSWVCSSQWHQVWHQVWHLRGGTGQKWAPDVAGAGGCSQSSANPALLEILLIAHKRGDFAVRWELTPQGLRVNPAVKIRRGKALGMLSWLKAEIICDSSTSSEDEKFNLPYHPIKLICVQTKGKKDFAPVLLFHPFVGRTIL